MTATGTVTKVKETGMIFRPHSIAAINEGRKTQTRRVVKQSLDDRLRFAHEDGGGNWIFWSGPVAPDMAEFTKKAYPNGEGIRCPYGRRDDLIYVKEAVWADWGSNAFHYSSDEPPHSSNSGFRWHCHQMPKSAARLWLVITNIRVERLQEISDEDAKAEGVQQAPYQENRIWIANPANSMRHITTFRKGWDSINAKRGYSWASNPWVWCLEFRKL